MKVLTDSPQKFLSFPELDIEVSVYVDTDHLRGIYDESVVVDMIMDHTDELVDTIEEAIRDFDSTILTATIRVSY